jgi:hypothetical protein
MWGKRVRQGEAVLNPVWISIVVAIGSFAVSTESIFLGYLLFVKGATGAFKFTWHVGDTGVGLESVAPGILLVTFGAALAAWTVHRMIAKPVKISM